MPLRSQVFKAWQDKRMMAQEKQNARPQNRPGATESFSRLIRLSLGRLLLSRACFRFTGRKSVTPIWSNATKISKPAKRASRVPAASTHADLFRKPSFPLKPGHSHDKTDSRKPAFGCEIFFYLAGFNAPISGWF
jgi:hypothetical protein